MTLTEDDLRTLLHAPVDHAVVDRVLDGVVATRRVSRPTRRPWRIGLVAGLGMLIVVGVALAVLAVRPEDRTPPRPPAATVPTTGPEATPADLSVGSTVVSFPVDSGYRTGDAFLGAAGPSVAASESVGVFRVGSSDRVARLQVVAHGWGTPDPPAPARGPVELANGYAARWVHQEVGAPSSRPVGDALTWTLDSGLIVAVSPAFDGSTDDTVVAIANAVRISTPTPLRVPFSAGSWPPGWEVNSVSSSYVGLEGQTGTAGRDVRIEIRAPGTDQTAVTIEASGNVTVHAGEGTPVVISGRTWGLIPTADLFSWRGPGWSVAVMATYGAGGHRTVSDAQLEDFIADLALAPSFADESTWFDATGALGP